MKRLLIFLLLPVLLSLPSPAVGRPDTDRSQRPLSLQEISLRPHPRLLAGPGELLSGETLAAAPGWVRGADSVITAFSQRVLELPPVERIKTGKRLLSVSREALKRIFYLSYTYRIHGGEVYARRAVEEMLAVCAFSDWNPSHFLDVGEMAMAVALGYDWLYGSMPPEERGTVVKALKEKAFDASENKKQAWFYTAENNWNSVCNAGLVFAAAAIWEEDPERCGEMLRRSLESNPKTLAASFEKDGGYPEGYNYWGYGVGFQILLFDALETAFGTDFGLLEPYREGFFRSAEFMRFMSTPAGFSFNYSDSGPRANGQYMQAWMAWKTGDLSLLYPELRLLEKNGIQSLSGRTLPFFLIVLARFSGLDIPAPAVQTFSGKGRTPVFIYRSGWESPADTSLGVKGGPTQPSHSHNDQGSFIFESEGVRWAVDLGMQDYYSLEKLGLDLWDMTQDAERWNVFRIGPFSHNILTVNGHRPKVHHPADIVRTWEGDARNDRRYGAEIELGKIYSEDLAACRREVWTDGNGELHVRDWIETGDSVCTVRWAMCPAAEAVLSRGTSPLSGTKSNAREKTPEGPNENGPGFILSGNGVRKQLTLRVLKDWKGRRTLSPEKGSAIRAEILPTTAPGPWLHDYDAPNPGTALLCYYVTLPPHTRVRLDASLR